MSIDSHAHLDGPRFDPDRAEVIARARAAGVSTILAIGIGEGPGTLDCAVKLAAQYPFIYATTGIHPHEAAKATDADFQQLEELARAPKVIACGEIGLDYYYDHSPRDIQKNVFIRQMETARPSLAPVPYRGKRNEPAYVIEVARQLAAIKNVTPKEIGPQTTNNFRRFFSLPE